MKKPEEIKFMKFVLDNAGRIPSGYWEALSKQQHSYLRKWSDKGLWEYGVSARAGWLTENGKAEFSKITEGSFKQE